MTSDNTDTNGLNWKKTLLISAIILLVAIIVVYIIFSTEPTAKREGATKETAMLVNVVHAEKGDYEPIVKVTGNVQAARDITISPRVSGEITKMSPSFVPGGTIKKGHMLLQIDPADYRIALQMRKSELSQAQADLKLEQGRQEVARQDYELLGDTIAEANRGLVLRQPQLESIQANIESAKSSVNQAQLDLQRTTIRAPFDAYIISRNVNVGSQVARGEALGRLVGMDEYWIVATVPLSKVNWLKFPANENEKGAEVKIYNPNAWPDSMYRTGYLYKQIGALEERTRLARVLVTVKDPLALSADNSEIPPLMIGSFVESHIKARELKDVVRLNRDHLRQDETVWVMVDGKLEIRKPEIVFTDAEFAYIRSGLNDNEKVVTTNLTTVVEGAGLRTEPNEQDSLANDQADTSGQELPDTPSIGGSQ